MKQTHFELLMKTEYLQFIYIHLIIYFALNKKMLQTYFYLTANLLIALQTTS